MSYGCPPLTSDIPECMELWADFSETTGIALPQWHSFAAGNAADLREALSRFLAEGEHAKKLAEAARSYVLNAYCWDDLTQKTLDVYAGKNNRADVPDRVRPPLFLVSAFSPSG